jgi:regulator of sigma E protease
MFILVLVIFVLILSLIVMVHEAGHYFVAKRNGVKVQEFGFGYPPRFCAWYKTREGKIRFVKGKDVNKRKDIVDTIFSLNFIPFGGFVKMLGEESQDKSKNSFSQKSPWVRAKIIVAGVVANFLLAWLLLTIWFWIIPKDIASQVVVVSVNQDSLAQEIGIKANDTIRQINDRSIETVSDLKEAIVLYRGNEVSMTISRFGKDEQKKVFFPEDTESPLGVSLAETGSSDNFPDVLWWQAPYWALMEIFGVVWLSLNFILGLIASIFRESDVSADMVAGPVGVFGLLYQIIGYGPAFVLRFIAMISIAVGFFNLLPIPALDGGHLLFIVGEAIRGKKIIKSQWENSIHWFGFILLLILFVVITYNDISKLIK